MLTVPHNEKGEAEITVKTWMNTHISAGIVELSQTLKLDCIPQASVVTATDGVIGGLCRLAVTRKNAQSTHAIGWQFGALSGYLDENGQMVSREVRFSAESLDVTLPQDFYGQIPDAKAGICYLTVFTYCDGRLVGTPQSAQFTVSVEEGLCIPQVSGTVVDVNPATLALTGDDSILIRHCSHALCTLTAVGKNNARIVEKRIDGISVEESLLVENVASGAFTLEAVDSRGFVGTNVLQSGWIPYTPVSCSATAARSSAAGNEAVLSLSGSFFSGSFGKTDNALQLSYSLDGEHFIPITAQPEAGSYQAQVQLTDVDYDRRYTITVRAQDCLSKAEKQVILKKAVPTFDWGENDFAFHVPVQLDSDLSVGGCLTVGGKTIFERIYPVGTVYTAAVQRDPGELFGGIWQQLEDQQSVYRWKRIG